MLRAVLWGGSLLLLIFIAFSCVDEIDLRQGDPPEDGIALSGHMFVQGEVATVTFRGGWLFRFVSNRRERLINAEVTVELSDGTDHLLDYDIASDLFTVSFNLPRLQQFGLQARIRVITEEGASFLSDWDPLPEELTPESLTPRQNFDSEGQPVSITYELKTPARRLDGSGSPFLYQFNRSFRVLSAVTPIRFCYFTETIQQLEYTVINPDADYSGDLRTIEIYKNGVDWRYAEGHYLNVTQQPISDAAYAYFSNFVSYVDRDRSIFEGPPGNLPGNFRSLTNPEQERIYGLFYVTRPEIVRSGIPGGEVDVEPFCVPISNHANVRCIPASCGRAGGVSRRPSYWAF